MDKIYCYGCGVTIQTDDEEKLGYAPKSALEKEEVICKRCFRLKHYNEVQDVDMDAEDFLSMIQNISKKDGIIVNVVDIFDVHGSLIPNLNRIVGNKSIILVGNKVDLLPKSTNLNKVKQWMIGIAKEQGLKVKEVFLVSSIKGIGMEEVTSQLESLRNGKDIYVVGCTNVGKSTFINYLINQSTDQKDVITTSYFPGTTLGFIEIPLDEKSSMIDTPGVINKHQMAHYLSSKDLKAITPKKEIKPIVYQLNDQQTLFIGGLARFDIEEASEKKGYVCYFANGMKLHRTKLENAERLYEEHLGDDLLSPPTEETLKHWPPLTEFTFEVNEKEKMDIVFSGLGWITVPSGKVKIRAYVPEGVKVVKRKAII